MENKNFVKCVNCNDEVPEHSIDRYGECRKCKLNDSGMCVGDLKK